MSSFKKVMEQKKFKSYAIAKNILRYDHVNAKEFFSNNRIALMAGAKNRIKQSVTHNKGTEEEACLFYSVASDYLANYFKFSSAYPEEYKVLVGKIEILNA